MAPAMAAGNTFVLKSSEKSPISIAQVNNSCVKTGPLDQSTVLRDGYRGFFT
jgi:acyl-CoA reductase-like NAD-dependent aldehyde dehydrogenase